MAELADAPGSGPDARESMGVRLPPEAPVFNNQTTTLPVTRLNAPVAKLVDAPGSGPDARKSMGVRVSPGAPNLRYS